MFLSLKRNIKTYLVLFLYIAFIIASMIGVIPFESKNHNQGFTSDELTLQEAHNDSLTTDTYVNTSNVITEAIDKGYAIKEQIKNENKQVIKETYYDANKKPVSLKKGQYGIKTYNDCTLYLDKNGNIQYSIDNMLNGYPVLVIVCGCIVSILLLILPYNMRIALTILYVFFILYETLMFRESGDARCNLVLFSYADVFFQNRMIRVEVINNVWLFIPFGIGMYRIYQRKSIFASAFIFSILIETTQYITGLGVAEFNDVFENTMGGMIGIVLASILIRQIKK